MTSSEPITVSVVIPTRNRPESLRRLLRALALQTRRPDEVLVVDASDRQIEEAALRASFPTLSPRRLAAAPGVCAQRNLGVRGAVGSHVLLCDDDVEPAPDYLEALVAYLRARPAVGAVTGVIREADGAGGFTSGFGVPSLRHLAFASLFQLTVWADVESVSERGVAAPLVRALKRWYRARGNRWSLAGWPLVTQVRGEVVHASVYGLGASLVRRAWLLDSPFDERIGGHGIGENYGVALGFPEPEAIAVLLAHPVLHHRAPENRLDEAETHFRRVLALDYFLRTSATFPRGRSLWLAWSLVGSMIASAARGRRAHLDAERRALGLVLSGRNPILPAAPR